MLKVVLVDDEINVVEGLRKTVPWQDHGCQLVGTANDGVAAMEVIRSTKPDIVITDITMPGMDGFELVDRLRPLYPAMRFIYLTCNDDFEMARQGFRSGACDYIIKETMTREELYRSLEKAGEEIYRYRENMLTQAVVSNELYWDNTGTNSVHGIEFLLDRVLRYSFDFESGRYWMALIYLLPEQGYTEADNVIKRALARHPGSYLFCRTEYEYVAMLRGGDSARGLAEQLCVRSGEMLKGCCRVYFYVHSTPCRRETLADTYQELCALRLCSFYSHNNLFFTSSEESTKKSELKCDHSKFIKQCEEAIFQLDEKAAMDAVELWLREARICQEDPAGLISDGEQALILLLHRAMKLDCSIDRMLPYLQRKLLYRVGSVFELEETLCGLLAEGIAALKEKASSAGGELFSKAVRFMEENLSQRLTLEQVARHISMNPSYFSRYFKSKVGENFVDYLVRRRMECAKEKLRFTTLPLESIAAEVGYSNTTYFNDSFKKYMGTTPGAYRKEVKKSE